MKTKRILCALLIMVSVVTMFDKKAYAVDSSEAISTRIDDLYNVITANGGYFNEHQNDECGKKKSGHSCKHCNLNNIVKADWFKEAFGDVNTQNFPISAGNDVWSCYAFAQFAEWYIFCADENDPVTRKRSENKSGSFNYDFLNKNATIGDYLSIDEHHGAVFISCDPQNGVYVLDNNYEGSYNCSVRKHYIPYSYANSVTVVHCYSKDSGRSPSFHNYSFCNHESFDGNGYCKNCGFSFDWNENRTPINGTIKPNWQSITVKERPYYASKTIASVKEDVTVTAKVENVFEAAEPGKHVWYEVKVNGRSEPGYVYCDRTGWRLYGSYYEDNLESGTGKDANNNLIINPNEPTMTSVGYNMFVDVGKGSTLRFCSSWSTDRKYEVASIPNGTVVYVYGTTVEQFDERTWAKINYDGADGWVNYKWLKTTAATSIEAPTLLAPNVIEDEPTPTPTSTPTPVPSSNPEPKLNSIASNMKVNVGAGSTLRFCSTVSIADEYEIDSIPNNATVYVYGITTQQYEDRTWAKINYNGTDGWVNYKWLAQMSQEPTPTPTPAPTRSPDPELNIIASNMKVDVGAGSTLRFCSTVSIADEYEIDSIPNNATVYVYGITTQQYEDRTWAKINYNGTDGWVNYKWLAQIPPEPTPPPAPTPTPSPTPEQQPEPDRSIIDLPQYYGQWVAGAYYSEHDIYDDMLTIEPIGSNEISLHWELYRIAGFSETATVDLQTGIAQFTINDFWSGTGHVVLKNGIVTMVIDTSTFNYVSSGDEHLYTQKRDVSTLPPQPEMHYDVPVLSISDYNTPSDMDEGSNFGIRGIIQTNSGLITDVWAYLYDANNNPVQSSHYTPGETSHDLRYSINNDLVFGKLTPGNYSYMVEAQAVNGDQTTKTQLINANFTVYAVPQLPQPIPEPEISNVGRDMRVNVGTGSTLRFCSTVSRDDAYEIGSIANGEVVYVYGTTYQKYEDRTWAKINYSGRDGWVNFEWLSLIEPDPVPTTESESTSRSNIPFLSIGEYNVPSDVNEGTNFGIRGTIQTNCGLITDVWAYLYDDNDSPVQSSHYTPGETSHDLRYSINNDLIFGKLSPGRYRYIVEARAVNGDQTEIKRLIDSTFEVKTVSVPQQDEPEIKAIGKEMKVNVGKGSTLRFCATVSRDDAYEIGSIPNGTTVYVYGTTIQKYEDRTWAKIRYDGRDGWVNYEWLS